MPLSRLWRLRGKQYCAVGNLGALCKNAAPGNRRRNNTLPTSAARAHCVGSGSNFSSRIKDLSGCGIATGRHALAPCRTAAGRPISAGYLLPLMLSLACPAHCGEAPSCIPNLETFDYSTAYELPFLRPAPVPPCRKPPVATAVCSDAPPSHCGMDPPFFGAFFLDGLSPLPHLGPPRFCICPPALAPPLFWMLLSASASRTRLKIVMCFPPGRSAPGIQLRGSSLAVSHPILARVRAPSWPSLRVPSPLRFASRSVRSLLLDARLLQ